MDKLFDLVSIGDISEAVVNDGNKHQTERVYGPAAYSSVAMARLGMKSGIVTHISSGLKDIIELFTGAGVDIQGIIRDVSRRIKTEDIPPKYGNCRFIYICPVNDEISINNLDGLTRFGQQSAVDLGGFVDSLLRKEDVSLSDMIPMAAEISSYFDFVKISESKGRKIFKKQDCEAWAGMLLERGTETVVVTCDNNDILLSVPGRTWKIPTIEGNIIDSTTAEHTFMGGFLSEYLRCGELLPAAVFGLAASVCAGRKSGNFSAEKLPTEAEVRDRIPEDILERIIEI